MEWNETQGQATLALWDKTDLLGRSPSYFAFSISSRDGLDRACPSPPTDTLSGSRWGSAGFASSTALPLAVESYLDINTKDEKVDFSTLNTQWPGFPPCLPEQKHSDPCSRQASGRSKTSGADLARGFVLYRPFIRADGWRVWSRMACKATTPTHRCLRRWSRQFFRAEAERFITDDWRVGGRRGTTHVGGTHTHRS